MDGIRLLNAGLNERNGEIVAHGWLDIEAMGLLKIGPYQREVLSKVGGRKTSLRRAVENDARLPDVMLGMRGEHFTSGRSGVMVLEDPTYIVDGLQRISAIKQYAEECPDKAKDLRIGAEVRFGTTESSEKDLFLILNTARIPVSPNVILRVIRDQHNALATLYGLSVSDKSFVLCGKVQWNQRMSRGELITALMLAKAARQLHITEVIGVGSEKAEQIATTLDNMAKEYGLNNYRENVKTFFELIDSCWPSRNIEYKDVAAHLKGNFLIAMAQLINRHQNFWKGERIFVDAVSKKKLATFPVQDPEISRLAAAGNQTLPILYNYLLEHFNKGKRAGRLTKRHEG